MSELDLPALAEKCKPQGDTKTPQPMQEINQAYKACKFGLFHIRLLAISFVGFVAGVLVSNSTAYLLPSAECDLGMTLVQKGLLNAIPYLGMLLSTAIAGFLTDTFGRKIFVLLGFGGMFLFMSIAASSQTYELLITAKFFEGLLFATSFSAVVTLTSEFCHNDIRDRVMLCQSSFAAVAQIVIAAMSWGILTQDWKYRFFDGKFVLNTWNFYLYLMSLWSLSAFFLYAFFLPESPKYLLTQKKYDEAREILIKIYRINTGKSPESYPYLHLWKDKAKASMNNVPEKKINTSFRHQIVIGLHNIKPMFRKPLVIYLTLICFANFMIMALYNVIRLWFPQLSTIVEHYDIGADQDMCVMLDKYTNDLALASLNSTSTDICVPTRSGNETYINSIIIGCVCLLPYFVTGILVNKVGKKPLMIIAVLICIAMTLGLRWANSKAAVVALFSIDVAVAQVMLSLNQALTVEFFPTTTRQGQMKQIRSYQPTHFNGIRVFVFTRLGSILTASNIYRTLAISLIMMAGRIGTLVGNITFPILLAMGCVIPFYTMTGMMVCVAVISLFLPRKK